MSNTEHRLVLPVALALANKIAAEIRPVCERCEIAGSIRRKRPDVGDIELVVIPLYAPDLFGGVGQSLLEPALLRLVEAGRLVPASKNLGVLKRYYIGSMHRSGTLFKLEINISTPERWPVELAIKTGPAEFSHRLVTPRSQGGYLPGDCTIGDGWQIRQDGELLRFASEQEFIEWACGQWTEPEKRQ